MIRMAAVMQQSFGKLLLSRTCLWRDFVSREVMSLSSSASRSPSTVHRMFVLSSPADTSDRVVQVSGSACGGALLSSPSRFRTFSTSSRRQVFIPVTKRGWGMGLTYVKRKMQNLWHMATTKKKFLRKSALVMYSCCTDPINHIHFFNVLGMPDTFNSWHKITELHVWMCAVRMANESHTGKFVRNEIVRAFWQDVDKRSMRLGPEVMVGRKKAVGELSDQFRATLFGYDEVRKFAADLVRLFGITLGYHGFLREDRHLAAALWRHFFAMDCDDPQRIELLVYYVRKQIENLEAQDSYLLMEQGVVEWLALSDAKD